MQCFLKSKYIKSRTFNDKNRLIIKKIMVLKKLLPHLATRGTYSPGDWRCDEAWREKTLVHPPVMCQQRLIYCTWELNVMWALRDHARHEHTMSALWPCTPRAHHECSVTMHATSTPWALHDHACHEHTMSAPWPCSESLARAPWECSGTLWTLLRNTTVALFSNIFMRSHGTLRNFKLPCQCCGIAVQCDWGLTLYAKCWNSSRLSYWPKLG